MPTAISKSRLSLTDDVNIPTLTPNFEKLLYHNQFILGPFFIEKLTSWKRVKINNPEIAPEILSLALPKASGIAGDKNQRIPAQINDKKTEKKPIKIPMSKTSFKYWARSD